MPDQPTMLTDADREVRPVRDTMRHADIVRERNHPLGPYAEPRPSWLFRPITLHLPTWAWSVLVLAYGLTLFAFLPDAAPREALPASAAQPPSPWLVALAFYAFGVVATQVIAMAGWETLRATYIEKRWTEVFPNGWMHIQIQSKKVSPMTTRHLVGWLLLSWAGAAVLAWRLVRRIK